MLNEALSHPNPTLQNHKKLWANLIRPHIIVAKQRSANTKLARSTKPMASPIPITLLSRHIRIGQKSWDQPFPISELIGQLGDDYEEFDRHRESSRDSVSVPFWVWPSLGIVASSSSEGSDLVTEVEVWFVPYDEKDRELQRGGTPGTGGPEHISVSPRIAPITIGGMSVSGDTTPIALLTSSGLNWNSIGHIQYVGSGNEKDWSGKSRRECLASGEWLATSWTTGPWTW